MRVLGIDPGNAVCGWGLIERAGAPRFLAAGTIRPRATMRGPARLKEIHDRLLELLDRYRPDAVSLERSFAALNVQSAFKLGEARAMAMLAAAERELALFEYNPTDVKLTIAGFGRADKLQVKDMVRRTLGLDARVALADDASDALAIALCHAFRARAPRPEPPRRMRPIPRANALAAP
jgi:crossover junction endodeoxyribonuclease RuvC